MKKSRLFIFHLTHYSIQLKASCGTHLPSKQVDGIFKPNFWPHTKLKVSLSCKGSAKYKFANKTLSQHQFGRRPPHKLRILRIKMGGGKGGWESNKQTVKMGPETPKLVALAALPKDLSSAPTAHTRQLTAVCTPAPVRATLLAAHS